MFKRLLNEENKKTTVTTAVAAVLCCGLGVLLHYAYEWSGGNLFVGLFAPVNESVWEHLKLLVMPLLFLMIFEFSIYGRLRYNFFTAKLLGTLVGILTILNSYYFYTGALGIENMSLNIFLFIAGVLTAYATSLSVMTMQKRIGGGLLETLSILALGALCALFFWFTLYPIHVPLFRDPMNDSYGIPKPPSV